jgi:hypothetical protein
MKISSIDNAKVNTQCLFPDFDATAAPRVFSDAQRSLQLFELLHVFVLESGSI